MGASDERKHEQSRGAGGAKRRPDAMAGRPGRRRTGSGYGRCAAPCGAIADGWPGVPATTSSSLAATAIVRPQQRTAQIEFEPNRGQAAPDAKYLARHAGFTAEILSDGMRLQRSPDAAAVAQPVAHPVAHWVAPASGDTSTADANADTDAPASSATLRFAGANRRGTFEAREPGPGVANYLVGADPSRWLRGVPRYRQLR